jgi:hypothetical protein
VIIPQGIVQEDFRFTIKKVHNPPAGIEGLPMGSVYDVTISSETSFEVPLFIKLKNIDVNQIDNLDMSRYKPAYFDEKAQKWKLYEKGGLPIVRWCFIRII